MSEVAAKPSPSIRPRDAATLVLLKRHGGVPRVLMGQRHKSHKFFPDAYVFPGGRVDRADSFVKPATPLPAHTALKLAKTLSPPRARAMALAAVRETFEETGLVIGQPAKVEARVPPAWREYFATGHAPALDGLWYICRAITPPFRPIRFNARFFLADADKVEGTLNGSGELLYLDWLPIPDALKLNLPGITKTVLEMVGAIEGDIATWAAGRDVPCYRTVHGQRVLEHE